MRQASSTSHRQPWLLILPIVVLIAIIGYLSHHERRIVIRSSTFDCVWGERDFTLKWRHSVEKQFWQEYYQMQDDQLHLTKTFMQTFGAGTPSTGQVIPAPEGYVGLSSNVLLPKIHWVVSSNMQGQIIGRQDIFSVYEHVPDYSEVQIAVETHPKGFWLIKESCHD